MKEKNKILSIATAALLMTTTSIYAQNLTSMESHSLQLAKKFINGKDKSFYRADGGVVFLHGGTLPSVLTAPLKLTDIQLEPGETIKEVQLGDTVRWQVSPSVSGSGDTQVSHVIVKPTDSALATTLNIFTDKRAYHINLKSTNKHYFPVVAFAYADQIQKNWNDYKQKVEQNKLAKTMQIDDFGGINVDNLDFSYDISGSAPWKPKRIFNDGIKTYIVMPRTMNANEAPVLLVLDYSGDEKIVNYRLLGDKFVVDKIFDKAILILGVGFTQQKITISRTR